MANKTRYLLIIHGDIEPGLPEVCTSDADRLQMAKAHRKENGYADGLYGLDIHWDTEDIDFFSFSPQEIDWVEVETRHKLGEEE